MATTGSCQETQGLLQVLVEGGLNATERGSVEAHMATCPACTAEGARLQANAAFLKETLGPFRMPADLTPEFLLALPRKDQKRRSPAPAAAAAPRTFVLGDTRARGVSPWKWIGGIGFFAAAAGLGWLFLSDGEKTVRRGPAPIPGAGERPAPGDGAADGKKVAKSGPRPGPADTGKKTAPVPVPPSEPVRTAAELAATLRGVRGEGGYTAVVHKGWALMATAPAEAQAVRDLAAEEKEARVRAGLVACLGADGGDENRTALRGYLGDEAPEVRGAAALALGRSLSIENQRKLLPSGPPLALFIDVGPMADDPARGDLAARLSVEGDAGVRRVLISVLAGTAPTDPAIRDLLLEGVKGTYGDEFQEPCVRALQGVKDPAVVDAFAAAMVDLRTPKSLHGALLEGMIAADEKAAGEKLAELLAGAQGADLRKEILGALGRVGGPAAQKAFTDALAGDADATVRLAAATSLQRYPSKEVQDALQRASENDSDQAVRQEAERVAKTMEGALKRAEGGGGDVPPVDPPHPAPNPAPDGN